MRKKNLLEMQHLEATQEMIAAAEADTYDTHVRHYNANGVEREYRYQHYTYYLFLRACVENDVLKVAVFTRHRLTHGKYEPQYEIYVSQKENRFTTYETESGRWRTARIEMLEFEHGRSTDYVHAQQCYESQQDRTLVNQYFNTENAEIQEVVLDFQNGIRGEKLARKHRNECRAIDAVMNEVPDLPQGFEEWIRHYGFIKHKYIFYKPGRKKPDRGYCTHCEQWVPLQDAPVHNVETICTQCGQRGTFKSWGKQKYIRDGEEIGILQRLNDRSGYIMRKFSCRIKRNKEEGWQQSELIRAETVRVRLTAAFAEAECFEYGEYKYTGIHRWCHTCRRSNWGYYSSPSFGSAVMYTGNLREELQNTAFGRCNIAELLRADEGENSRPAYLLQRLYQYPFIEYLQKNRLFTLAGEIVNAQEDKSLFALDKTTMQGVLQIDKQRINRLREVNGGCAVLLALQYEQQEHIKLTQEHLKYIRCYKININRLQMDRTHMGLIRTLNFLKRQQELLNISFGDTLSRYKDYLDMAAERGMDLTDEIVCRNSRMSEYHDRYVEEKNRKRNDRRDKEVDKKFGMIKKNAKRNQKHFGYQQNGYVIIAAGKASDITREGRLQHHCVGASDRYMSAMDRDDSFILFLRNEQMPEVPYYTLEVKWDGTVQQAYAAYDRKPNWSEVEKYLKKWKREIKKRTDREEKTQRKVKERLLVAAV